MEKRFFMLIMSIRKKCLQTEEKIRTELGLTSGEFNGLLSIEPEERIPAAEFSQRMALSPSRGSRVLSRLLHGGLIRLESVPGDRRSIWASLTPRGEKKRRRIEERMQECENRIESRLDPSSRDNVRDALERLIEAMEV